ncbi:MAG: hypothetical protein QM713_03155 [Arachnia sp.]
MSDVRITRRLGLTVAAALAVGIVPLTTLEAQAAPSSHAAAQQQSKTTYHQARTQVHKHGKSCTPRRGTRCPHVKPYTGLVKRCQGSFTRRNHADLLGGEVWSPNFEPGLDGFGRSGAYFVYVGNTPVGWVDMHRKLGGVITLTEQYGTFKKGKQRIALYDSYGRLVVWDWITLDWDW